MERNTLIKGLAVLVRTFPEKIFEPDLLWEFLKDLDDQSFLESITKIIATKHDVNKATNIIALIRDNAIPEGLTAGEAWREVLRQISKAGSYGSPEFSDALIGQAVACIGWRTLCLSENISIERAHFLKSFESISKRQRTQDLISSQDTLKLTASITKGITHVK